MADTLQFEDLRTPERDPVLLSREALWFCAHTGVAMLTLAAVVAGVGWVLQPDASAEAPKLAATVLAFLAPGLTAFGMTRLAGNTVGRHLWVAGLLVFSLLTVWVIDLPTGPGQCDHCLVFDRLVRTFFDLHNGSGMLGGNGLLLGTWVPLATFGYTTGARFAS